MSSRLTLVPRLLHHRSPGMSGFPVRVFPAGDRLPLVALDVPLTTGGETELIAGGLYDWSTPKSSCWRNPHIFLKRCKTLRFICRQTLIGCFKGLRETNISGCLQTTRMIHEWFLRHVIPFLEAIAADMTSLCFQSAKQLSLKKLKDSQCFKHVGTRVNCC